jgi:hypothetical protein
MKIGWYACLQIKLIAKLAISSSVDFIIIIIINIDVRVSLRVSRLILKALKLTIM